MQCQGQNPEQMSPEILRGASFYQSRPRSSAAQREAVWDKYKRLRAQASQERQRSYCQLVEEAEYDSRTKTWRYKCMRCPRLATLAHHYRSVCGAVPQGERDEVVHRGRLAAKRRWAALGDDQKKAISSKAKQRFDAKPATDQERRREAVRQHSKQYYQKNKERIGLRPKVYRQTKRQAISRAAN